MKHISSFLKEETEARRDELNFSVCPADSVSRVVRPMQIQIHIVPCHEVGHGVGYLFNSREPHFLPRYSCNQLWIQRLALKLLQFGGRSYIRKST